MVSVSSESIFDKILMNIQSSTSKDWNDLKLAVESK